MCRNHVIFLRLTSFLFHSFKTRTILPLHAAFGTYCWVVRDQQFLASWGSFPRCTTDVLNFLRIFPKIVSSAYYVYALSVRRVAINWFIEWELSQFLSLSLTCITPVSIVAWNLSGLPCYFRIRGICLVWRGCRRRVAVCRAVYFFTELCGWRSCREGKVICLRVTKYVFRLCSIGNWIGANSAC